ncbi:hypothetical protein HHK36_015671 [Tetracentron sinense]|uniref:Cytochrome P450 n=1 Tax=Tetracentron sinense TaxID=13715 RepID=A0A834Z3I1_TETSI|nr:hypothetical protein HHK36_015671 [Tetracentron sinense]
MIRRRPNVYIWRNLESRVSCDLRFPLDLEAAVEPPLLCHMLCRHAKRLSLHLLSRRNCFLFLARFKVLHLWGQKLCGPTGKSKEAKEGVWIRAGTRIGIEEWPCSCGGARLNKTRTSKYNLPPSLSKLPIIGNLHQLGLFPHRALRSLAQHHGPLMLLHLGSAPTVVVSSAEVAREIMKTHDLNFSSRPYSSIAKRLLYDHKDLAFAPYGEYWRQMRRICILQLLSTKRVQSFRAVREEEIALVIKKIEYSCSSSSALVDLSEILVSLMKDIVSRVAFGRKYNGGEGEKNFKEMARELVVLLGVFDVKDFIPSLAWVNCINGLNTRVEKNFREIDCFLDGVIEDHINCGNRSVSDDGGCGEVGDDECEDEKDLVDVLLGIQKDCTIGVPFDKENIKGIILGTSINSAPTVVVSSAEVAREIMKTHDLNFSSRPDSSIAKRLLYDHKDLAFAPYGEYWRQMRRICMLQLLSTKRVQSFRAVREEETALVIKKIEYSCSSSSALVDLSEILVSLMKDIVSRVAFGRKYNGWEGERNFKEMARELVALLGVFDVKDFIPSLAWVNCINGLNTRVEKNFREIDCFLDGVVEDHINCGNRSVSDDGGRGEVGDDECEDEKDLVDVLLGIQKDCTIGVPFDKENIKGWRILMLGGCRLVGAKARASSEPGDELNDPNREVERSTSKKSADVHVIIEENNALSKAIENDEHDILYKNSESDALVITTMDEVDETLYKDIDEPDFAVVYNDEDSLEDNEEPSSDSVSASLILDKDFENPIVDIDLQVAENFGDQEAPAKDSSRHLQTSRAQSKPTTRLWTCSDKVPTMSNQLLGLCSISNNMIEEINAFNKRKQLVLPQDPDWIPDTGASSHMTNNPGIFTALRPYNGGDKIIIGNGQSLSISHIGDASVPTNSGSLHLKNVLLVPKITKNLLSVGQLTDEKCCMFEFDSRGFVIKDQKSRKVLARGIRDGNLYSLGQEKRQALFSSRHRKTSEVVWHQREDSRFGSLRTFGCRCFPCLRDYTKNKFSPKSVPCIFVGYSSLHKGYRCLLPETGRVFISRHVVFDETCFPYANKVSSLNSHVSQVHDLEITTFAEWLDNASDDIDPILPSTQAAIPDKTNPSSLQNVAHGLSLSDDTPIIQDAAQIDVPILASPPLPLLPHSDSHGSSDGSSPSPVRPPSMLPTTLPTSQAPSPKVSSPVLHQADPGRHLSLNKHPMRTRGKDKAGLIHSFTRHRTSNYNLPPSLSKLPIIGNLHQLGLFPHRALRSFAQRHGPLMLLHLGSAPTVVVSSAQVAREIMKTHDLNFSSRPDSSIAKRLMYDNKDLAFAPYGEYWRQMRRICTLQLLSMKRVESFQAVREEETALMIEKIECYSSSSASMDLSEMLVSLANDIVCRVAFGKKYSGRNFKEMMMEFGTLLGVFNVGDFIPSLSWLNYINGLNARVEKIFRELDCFLDGVIEDHISSKNRVSGDGGGGDDEGEDEKDLVDVLLGIQKDCTIGVPIGRDNIKAIILVMEMSFCNYGDCGSLLESSSRNNRNNLRRRRRSCKSVKGLLEKKAWFDITIIHSRRGMAATVMDSEQLIGIKVLFCNNFCVADILGVGSTDTVKNNHVERPNLPPSPPKLPIIGHLHQLGMAPHRWLWQQSKIYGPVMLIHLGRVPMVVVSTAEMAKEVFKTHDLDCCARPLQIGPQKLSYNYSDVVFAPHGEYWREMRKIFALELFGPKRLQTHRFVREDEVARMINSISQASASPINLTEKLFSLTDNIICRVAFGRSYEGKVLDNGRLHELLGESLVIMASFNATDFFPPLGWTIDMLTGIYAKIEKHFNLFDGFYQRIIDEHLDPERPKSEHEDILDVLLRLEREEYGTIRLTKDHVKAILMLLLLSIKDHKAICVPDITTRLSSVIF